MSEPTHGIDCEAGDSTLVTPAPCTCGLDRLKRVEQAARGLVTEWDTTHSLGDDDFARLFGALRAAVARVTEETGWSSRPEGDR